MTRATQIGDHVIVRGDFNATCGAVVSVDPDYILRSVKGDRGVKGTLAHAVSAAVAMEADLQPAYGVTVERDGYTLATVIDGYHDLVVVETMPKGLRSSHEAAGNRGSYPHNGAARVLMDRANAEIFVDDDDWTCIVRAATDRDLAALDYATEC